jgi:alpha-N-arabinofuranosidase
MSASAAVVGRWYHIAGVYDASKKTIALYLDGKLQEVLPYNSAWQATGSTVIGRGKWDGNNADFMNGTVDDVRIYDVALSPLDIQALAGKKNPPH